MTLLQLLPELWVYIFCNLVYLPGQWTISGIQEVNFWLDQTVTIKGTNGCRPQKERKVTVKCLVLWSQPQLLSGHRTHTMLYAYLCYSLLFIHLEIEFQNAPHQKRERPQPMTHSINVSWHCVQWVGIVLSKMDDLHTGPRLTEHSDHPGNIHLITQ